MLSWDDVHISKDALRAEVDDYVALVKDVLLDHFGAGVVDAIYFEGSASKSWGAPIDYVPLLSDIDIHVRFVDASTADMSLEDGLSLRKGIDEVMFAQDRLHHPRIQLTWLDTCEHLPDFIPAPTAVTVYGTPYSSISSGRRRELEPVEREKLFKHKRWVDDLPRQLPGRCGADLVSFVRSLAWRVSGCAPRVLSAHGVDPSRAWSLNRSGLVAELELIGYTEIAAHYASFYESFWQYLSSGDASHLELCVRAAYATVLLSYDVLSKE